MVKLEIKPKSSSSSSSKPRLPKRITEDRVGRLGEDGGRRVTVCKMQGSHHNHLDLPEANGVARVVAKWLLDPSKDVQVLEGRGETDLAT